MGNILRRLRNCLAHPDASFEEWSRQARVHEDSKRRIAEDQTWREQERRTRGEELLRYKE